MISTKINTCPVQTSWLVQRRQDKIKGLLWDKSLFFKDNFRGFPVQRSPRSVASPFSGVLRPVDENLFFFGGGEEHSSLIKIYSEITSIEAKAYRLPKSLHRI